MNFCVVTLPMDGDTVLAPCMFEGKVTVHGLSPVGICTKMKVTSMPGSMVPRAALYEGYCVFIKMATSLGFRLVGIETK